MSATPSACHRSGVLDALRTVMDPDRGEDIVSARAGDATCTCIDTATCRSRSPSRTSRRPTKATLHSSATKAVSQLPGVRRCR